MQLLIDNKPVIVKKGTSIRLTRENPAISQNGDYTLDVTLPLSGCLENINVFGIPHYRHQPIVGLADKTFQFALEASLLRLTGTAVVTQVSEEEIKLQLLAGNTELNFDNREGGEKYIDELDLGRAYDEEWKADTWIPSSFSQNAKNTARCLHSLSTLIPSAQRADQLMHGTNEQTNCVLFPIYSTADGAFSNRQEIQYFVSKKNANSNPVFDYVGYRFSLKNGMREYLPNSNKFYIPVVEEAQGLNFTDDMRLAPQPYLCFILERVLAAIGYELRPKDNCMRQGWLGKIFIANARETIEFCECLPHWTVQDFLTELRNAFGVVIYAEGKKCRAVSRSSIYIQSNIKTLYNVIDERSVEISADENNTSTSSGNVSYNHSDSVPNRLNIGTAPYENMEVLRVASAQHIFNSMMGEGGTAEEKEKIANSSILFYEKYSGSRYGCFNTAGESEQPNYELREVDQLGPLFRNETYDEGTTLNIVPAFMGEDVPTHRHRFDKYPGTEGDGYKGTFYEPKTEEPTQEEGGDMYGFFVPYIVTTDSRVSYTRSKFSLQKYLQDGTGTTESSDNATRDIMEVAVNAGQYSCKWNSYPDDWTNNQQLSLNVPYAIGSQYMVDRMDEGNIKKIGLPDHFSLHSAFNSNMINNLNGSIIRFDSRIVHQFSFTDREYDPTKLFIINGRRFACQKLELTINEEGISPLIKGYFFELQ